MLLLLLSGCAKDGAVTPTPSASSPLATATAAPASATPSLRTAPTPSPAPEPAWWEGLSADALPTPGGDGLSLENGTTVDCLEDLSPTNTSLYLVWEATENEPCLWLRRDASFQCLAGFTAYDALATHALTWLDYDGDKTDELLLLFRNGEHAALAVCEWEDGWAAVHSFDSSVYDPLLRKALAYEFDGETATVTLGESSASYDLGPGDEEGEYTLAPFGDLVFFTITDSDISAVFGVNIAIGGREDTMATLGTVSAKVTYSGKGFSLTDLALISVGGV